MARKQWVNGKINEVKEAEKNLFDTMLFLRGVCVCVCVYVCIKVPTSAGLTD